MTQALADAQTRAMEDVLHTLKQVAKRERLI